MGWVPVGSAFIAFTAFAQLACAAAASAGPHDELIAKHAAANAVPEALVRRVIHIESRGNAHLVAKGNYGLMQIRLGTARAMGYSGDAKGLLDADTNMTYAVRYLAGAYRAAGCNADRAVHYYQRGYYGARHTKCPAIQFADATAKVDVIKPRVVRIETIGSAAPSRPAVPFEPARGANRPPLSAGTAARGLQLASIPLPPSRPEFEPLQQQHKAAKSRHSRKHGKAESALVAEKTGGSADPIGVVSLLKKIVATDKPSGKRAAREAQQPSPPPPQ